jgi:hypothetical protein
VGIYQILGTGISTVSGLYIDSGNKIMPSYNKNGDGIVEDMYSARYGTTTYVDLKDTKNNHSNIMNNKDVISSIDNIINPITVFGLDYNKILKNNNYNLLQISESSEGSVPDIDIILSMNNFYKDKYYSYKSKDFNNVTESLDKNNRFEIYDKQIQYIYDKEIDNLIIDSKTDNFLDLNILKNIDGNISNTELKNIPVFKDVPMMIENLEIPVLKLPITCRIVNLADAVRLSKEEIIEKIILEIRSSSMEKYLKDRYIRRVELYRKNKDLKYLDSLKNKLSDSINSINKIAYSSALKARYSKLKEDYVYLNILLLRL